MKVARDVMETPRVVRPEQPLTELALTLLNEGVDALCVADGHQLVGVLTGMDLVYREKRVQLPVTITVLDLVLQLGARRTEREIEKMAAVRVSELMTRDVVTVGPDTPVDEVATQMVEKHLSMVPVVEAGRLIGVVTRGGMVRLALQHILGANGE